MSETKKRKRPGAQPSRAIRARREILAGRSDKQIKARLGIAETTINAQRKLLARRSIKPTAKLLTVEQAAFVLGLTARRVRAICQEGRIGMRVGARSYVIERGELLAFASLERPCGTPGQSAKAEENERLDVAAEA